jgi:hypothetical protein
MGRHYTLPEGGLATIFGSVCLRVEFRVKLFEYKRVMRAVLMQATLSIEVYVIIGPQEADLTASL